MIRVLKRRVVREEHAIGDSLTELVTLKAPKVSAGKVMHLIEALLSYRCYCSHDCCGHMQSTVWTHTLRHQKRREWTVEVHHYRNI